MRLVSSAKSWLCYDGVDRTAPILPYLLLVLILIFRPRGLLGSRED
jgi:branched-subunit amino acid ABC-type transport system permease component